MFAQVMNFLCKYTYSKFYHPEIKFKPLMMLLILLLMNLWCCGARGSTGSLFGTILVLPLICSVAIGSHICDQDHPRSNVHETQVGSSFNSIVFAY